MSKAKKIIKYTVIIILTLIALVLFAARLYFRIPVSDFYKNSRKAFVIPDTNYGYIAQGLDYDEATGLFFLTGYMSNHMSSPIYIVDERNKDNNKVIRLKLESGADNLTHAGGISVYGDYIYIAGCGDRCLYVYSKDEVMNADSGRGVKCLGGFMTQVSDDDYINADFTTINDGLLYVGEFFREENYQTLPSHKLTTGGGDYNQALVLAFELSDEYEFGINPVPVKAYSVTDLVQGMCFDDENIYLSTSYAIADSHIYVYPKDVNESEKKISVLGADVSLYELDNANLIKDIKIAPMSEEIEIVDGEMYINCESASNKYFFGKLTGGKWCYAMKIG